MRHKTFDMEHLKLKSCLTSHHFSTFARHLHPKTSFSTNSFYTVRRTHELTNKRITSHVGASANNYAPDEYMLEYNELKAKLLNNTRISGGVVALYLLLTTDGLAALCASLGMAASYAYLHVLCQNVDSVQASDRVALSEAKKIENSSLRAAATVLAAYSHALRPRLLIPIGAAAAVSVVEAVSGTQIDLLYKGCILVGFLSYKIALVILLIDELSPKAYVTESSRPRVERFEDELDIFGRPKKAFTTSPTAVLPEDVAAAELPLLPKLLKSMDTE